MNPDNTKPLSREEVKEIVESYDFLDREDILKLIEKKYWELEEEKKELWRSEKPV